MFSCHWCGKPHVASLRSNISASVSLVFFKFNPAASITQRAPILTLLFLLLSAEKPLPQGPPGGVIGILGGVVAIGLIIGVAVTVFMVHRRQQKTRTETDNDLWVLSLCQGILQGAGQVVRLGVHSCQPTREKHFYKDKTLFLGELMCSKAEEHTENTSLPPSYSFWEPVISFPIGHFMKNNLIAPRFKKKASLSLFTVADRIDDYH